MTKAPEPRAGGVAAPLEPTPEAEQFCREWMNEHRVHLHKAPYGDVVRIAEAYAAAVSKKLREELADMRGIISGLQDVIAGKTRPFEQIRRN